LYNVGLKLGERPAQRLVKFRRPQAAGQVWRTEQQVGQAPGGGPVRGRDGDEGPADVQQWAGSLNVGSRGERDQSQLVVRRQVL
jgi:hypothetical protein